MPQPWTSDFATYPTVIDEVLSVVTVDRGAIAHGPGPEHPVRMLITFRLLDLLPNGLRTPAEAQRTAELEARLVAHLRPVDGWFVGRVIGDGECCVGFYTRSERLAELDFDRGWTPYVLQVDLDADPDWAFLTDFLAPDARQEAAIGGGRVLHQLRSVGDRVETRRPVEHTVVFPTSEAATRAIAGLTRAGFSMVGRTDDPIGVALTVQRDDAPTDYLTFMPDVQDVTDPLGGRYDGWGAPVRR